MNLVEGFRFSVGASVGVDWHSYASTSPLCQIYLGLVNLGSVGDQTPTQHTEEFLSLKLGLQES